VTRTISGHFIFIAVSLNNKRTIYATDIRSGWYPAGHSETLAAGGNPEIFTWTTRTSDRRIKAAQRPSFRLILEHVIFQEMTRIAT
jgi:hypothetical protein